MADNALTKTAIAVVAGILAVAGGFWIYNQYIEPQNDGPMERAGERIDEAIDGN